MFWDVLDIYVPNKKLKVLAEFYGNFSGKKMCNLTKFLV